jgi:hypothetical protein
MVPFVSKPDGGVSIDRIWTLDAEVTAVPLLHRFERWGTIPAYCSPQISRGTQNQRISIATNAAAKSNVCRTNMVHPDSADGWI